MASMRDAQDMLGLPNQAGPKPKPAKKKKGAAAKSDGLWNKEIRSLIGERAPPAHLIEAQPQYQKKRAPVKTGPVRRWHFKPFNNDARTDGLLFRHWRRTELDSKPFTRDGGMQEVAEEEQEKVKAEFESTEGPEYKFGAKYNPQVDAPQFDHDAYEQSLQSDDWTEAETRYLMECYKDYYGKWPVIWDRYEWDRTSENPNAATTQQQAGDEASEEKPETKIEPMDVDDPSQVDQQEQQGPTVQETLKPRSLEDLKHRFYTVSAALLALQTPPTQMTASQYRLHEQMTRYNPVNEVSRKRFKEHQMVRSKEEKHEEEYLLAELRRIYFNQEHIDAELRELRGRLDHTPTDDRLPAQQYTTNRELTDLFNRFVRKENAVRPPGQPQGPRRSLPGQDGAGAGSPTTGFGPGQKKGGAAADGGAQAAVRQLTPRAQVRNGLSSHERLTSGITFRSDRITKIRSPSKSAQTNNKIATLLAQIEIPEFLPMPTVAVTKMLEAAVALVTQVVEVRRGRERLEQEAKVLEKMLGLDTKTEGGDGDGDGGADAEKKEDEEKEDEEKEDETQADEQAATVDGQDEDGDAEAEAEASQDAEGSPDEDDNDNDNDNEQANAEGSALSASTRNKRSASELSASSTASGRPGTKRQKSLRK